MPFCVSKCRYCDFNSWKYLDDDLHSHVEGLISEAQLRAKNLRPQTVFVGGGTPSILPPELLSQLLHDLHEITGFRDSALEVTMEANPESLDSATAQAALEGGVNRISIGVQSLRPNILSAYDRAHSPQEALDAFVCAKKIGIRRINVDLIYAFPGQDPNEWEEDLIRILNLHPSHISCYELAFEPGTALTRRHQAGRFPAEDPDIQRSLFDSTKQLCEQAGYSRYEVSNFAQPGEECLHNLVYWRSLDWVGIGPGATSWLRGVRSKNIDSPATWLEKVAHGHAVEESEAPAPQAILFDCLMMGLRLEEEGVSLSRIRRISQCDPMQELGGQLSALQKEGLLELHQDRIRTTPRGFVLLDSVLERLLPSISV
ncbi:MAG: radical SAM family heme chaperone HemW [Planctomycetes bacterium]|nr:radical SAM family heme chaperone HemW [Planctomycetota bacterium]